MLYTIIMVLICGILLEEMRIDSYKDRLYQMEQNRLRKEEFNEIYTKIEEESAKLNLSFKEMK